MKHKRKTGFYPVFFAEQEIASHFLFSKNPPGDAHSRKMKLLLRNRARREHVASDMLIYPERKR